ncbi:hypothetical protein chiPu_0030390, partial [Chiloscyllium punctatum]|nr:hypothetical protein [Chiloscyllium punctatum]
MTTAKSACSLIDRRHRDLADLGPGLAAAQHRQHAAAHLELLRA